LAFAYESYVVSTPSYNYLFPMNEETETSPESFENTEDLENIEPSQGQEIAEESESKPDPQQEAQPESQSETEPEPKVVLNLPEVVNVNEFRLKPLSEIYAMLEVLPVKIPAKASKSQLLFDLISFTQKKV